MSGLREIKYRSKSHTGASVGTRGANVSRACWISICHFTPGSKPGGTLTCAVQTLRSQLVTNEVERLKYLIMKVLFLLVWWVFRVFVPNDCAVRLGLVIYLEIYLQSYTNYRAVPSRLGLPKGPIVLPSDKPNSVYALPRIIIMHTYVFLGLAEGSV